MGRYIIMKFKAISFNSIDNLYYLTVDNIFKQMGWK